MSICRSPLGQRMFGGAVFLVFASIIAWGSPAVPQEPRPAATWKTRLAKARRETRTEGLPMFYGEVITPEQRKKIAEINRPLRKKIDQLMDEAGELESQRQRAIDELLTREQRLQVVEIVKQISAQSESEAVKHNLRPLLHRDEFE